MTSASTRGSAASTPCLGRRCPICRTDEHDVKVSRARGTASPMRVWCVRKIVSLFHICMAQSPDCITYTKQHLTEARHAHTLTKITPARPAHTRGLLHTPNVQRTARKTYAKPAANQRGWSPFPSALLSFLRLLLSLFTACCLWARTRTRTRCPGCRGLPRSGGGAQKRYEPLNNRRRTGAAHPGRRRHRGRSRQQP